MLLDAGALTPISSTLPTSVGVAVVLGYLMDLAKRLKQVPWVSYYTTKLNTYLRLITSAVGTIGISWVWSSTANGGHQWIVTIPATMILLGGIWHWIVQFGMQHGFEQLLQLRPLPLSPTEKLDKSEKGTSSTSSGVAAAVNIDKSTGK